MEAATLTDPKIEPSQQPRREKLMVEIKDATGGGGKERMSQRSALSREEREMARALTVDESALMAGFELTDLDFDSSRFLSILPHPFVACLEVLLADLENDVQKIGLHSLPQHYGVDVGRRSEAGRNEAADFGHDSKLRRAGVVDKVNYDGNAKETEKNVTEKNGRAREGANEVVDKRGGRPEAQASSLGVEVRQGKEPNNFADPNARLTTLIRKAASAPFYSHRIEAEFEYVERLQEADIFRLCGKNPTSVKIKAIRPLLADPLFDECDLALLQCPELTTPSNAAFPPNPEPGSFLVSSKGALHSCVYRQVKSPENGLFDEDEDGVEEGDEGEIGEDGEEGNDDRKKEGLDEDEDNEEATGDGADIKEKKERQRKSTGKKKKDRRKEDLATDPNASESLVTYGLPLLSVNAQTTITQAPKKWLMIRLPPTEPQPADAHSHPHTNSHSHTQAPAYAAIISKKRFHLQVDRAAPPLNDSAGLALVARERRVPPSQDE